MGNLGLVLEANRAFSLLLKAARLGGTGTDPSELALRLGISEFEYYRLEFNPVRVPACLLYRAIELFGAETMAEARRLWLKLQIERFMRAQHEHAQIKKAGVSTCLEKNYDSIS